jgi:hypothetical protein
VNLLVKCADTSSPREAIPASSSAVGVLLDVFGIAMLFLTGGFPGRHQMVVFPLGVTPDLEDDRAKVAATPPDCTKLFRIVIPLVNQVNLVEDLLRLFQADAMFSFDVPALLQYPLEAATAFWCGTFKVDLKPGDNSVVLEQSNAEMSIDWSPATPTQTVYTWRRKGECWGGRTITNLSC